MVQFFRGSADPRDAAYGALAKALGMGIGQGVNAHFANKELEDVLNDPELKDAPQSEKMQALQSRLSKFGEGGRQLFQDRMQIEQKQAQEQEQNILGKINSGKEVNEKELSRLSPESQFKYMETRKRDNAGKSVKQALIKAGYPEETAQIWEDQVKNSTTGGISDVFKNVNDLLVRSKKGKGITEETPTTQQSKPSIDIPGLENETFDLDFPELPEPVGLKPADVVKQNEHRERVNIPVYTKAVDTLNALDDEYRDITHLQELDATGKLPTGIEKWNVDWETGKLRAKALGTPEAQDYVKTIARMARKAKEFFPGRVTNFDLEQFQEGFPTLANSPEGRKIIAEQLSLANRIAYLKDETMKAAYDHYGSGSDPILVKKYATENYRRLKGELENKLKSVNERADGIVGREQEPVPLEKAATIEDIWK
jgi:hypothetical protein